MEKPYGVAPVRILRRLKRAQSGSMRAGWGGIASPPGFANPHGRLAGDFGPSVASKPPGRLFPSNAHS